MINREVAKQVCPENLNVPTLWGGGGSYTGGDARKWGFDRFDLCAIHRSLGEGQSGQRDAALVRNRFVPVAGTATNPPVRLNPLPGNAKPCVQGTLAPKREAGCGSACATGGVQGGRLDVPRHERREPLEPAALRGLPDAPHVAGVASFEKKAGLEQC